MKGRYNKKMNIGCHVSIAGGIENAPKLARELGCEVMQIFTRSPQGGRAPELIEKTIKAFKENCEKYGIKNVYAHTPYFINLASDNNKIYYGSISAIKTELERSSALGAKYVMTHLGSAKDLGEKESLKKALEGLEKIFEDYKGKTKLLIENSAGAGKIIGADFEQIGKILKEFLALAGMCLDTQHSFASGYDWRNNFDNNIKILEKHIGINNVKLIHANDSETDLGSRKDRHAHIGKGKIRIGGFEKMVQFAKEYDIDMICETEYPGVAEDILILKKLR